MSMQQAALGGAHTLLLCTRDTRPTLAYPWAHTSVVLAFGCGANGQLGMGAYSAEVLTPRTAAFAKDVPLLRGE